MKILITEQQLGLLTENRQKGAIQKMYALCFRQISNYFKYQKINFNSLWIEGVDLVSPGMDEIMYFLRPIYNGSVRPDINWGNDDLISDSGLGLSFRDYVEYLPNNLKEINGNLTLEFCENFKALPDNLNLVVGSINLSHTSVTSLPDNLKVVGDLYLIGSKITSLPNGLNASGLSIKKTPLSEQYSYNEIKEMIKDKGGNVKYIFT